MIIKTAKYYYAVIRRLIIRTSSMTSADLFYLLQVTLSLNRYIQQSPANAYVELLESGLHSNQASFLMMSILKTALSDSMNTAFLPVGRELWVVDDLM